MSRTGTRAKASVCRVASVGQVAGASECRRGCASLDHRELADRRGPARVDRQVRGGQVMRTHAGIRSRPRPGPRSRLGTRSLWLAFLFATSLPVLEAHAQSKTGTTFGAFLFATSLP